VIGDSAKFEVDGKGHPWKVDVLCSRKLKFIPNDNFSVACDPSSPCTKALQIVSDKNTFLI